MREWIPTKRSRAAYLVAHVALDRISFFESNIEHVLPNTWVEYGACARHGACGDPTRSTNITVI